MNERKLLEEEKGITLVALIITIIVLIILAAVTIMAVQNTNLVERTQNATIAYEMQQRKESDDLNAIDERLQSVIEKIGGKVPEIPDGLKIGSTVKYNPSGEYNWQAKYYSSTKTETTDDVLLKSSSGESFNISTWKVISINKGTGKVELVPSNQTTGKVWLEGSQGYNNGVKLLNEACSALYGDKSKKIEARSMNIEDLEKYMTEEAKTTVHSSPWTDQVSTPCPSNLSKYPAIYKLEDKAVINGQEKTGGLKKSEQKSFIERTQDGAEKGTIYDGTTTIQPYNNSFNMGEEKLKNAIQTDEDYYGLLFPDGESSAHWLASRRVFAVTYEDNQTYPVQIAFGVSDVMRLNNALSLNSMSMLANYDEKDDKGADLALFPVVTLSADLIKSENPENSEFKVE